MSFSERRNAPGEILNLEDQHSLLRLPDFTGLDASLALAGASPFVVVSPCGAAPLLPVPSGPRGSPLFVTSLWSLRPRVTSSWPFVTTSRPHAASAVSRTHFIDLAPPPGAALVPRPFPDFRFSRHEAVFGISAVNSLFGGIMG